MHIQDGGMHAAFDQNKSIFVMLLWVYIHTGQAWKICLATVGIEPTTFGILAQCSVGRALG